MNSNFHPGIRETSQFGNFRIFSTLQILREINFGSSKTTIFAVSEAFW